MADSPSVRVAVLTINQAKVDLATAIKAAVTTKTLVEPFLPKAINKESAVVFAPAHNYVMPAEDFGTELTIRLDVYVLVTVKDNKSDDARLDELLATVIPAITWEVDAVEQPDIYKFGGWQLYGTRISVSTTHP